MKTSNIIYCVFSLICILAMMVGVWGKYSVLNDIEHSYGIVFALSGAFGVLTSQLFEIFMKNILSKDNEYYDAMRFVFLIAISTGMMGLLVKWRGGLIFLAISLILLLWGVGFAIYQVFKK